MKKSWLFYHFSIFNARFYWLIRLQLSRVKSMPAAQGNRRSQRSQCQQKKVLSDQDMDRTALYRLGTAAESLNPVCILSCMHAAGSPEQFVFPRGGAALSRAKCPTRTMAPLRVLHREAERTDKMGRNFSRKNRDRWARVLLGIHHLTFAVLIYMKINSVGRRVPGCCHFLCDSNQSGMWGCKFLLHLIPPSLSLSFSLWAIDLKQIIYSTVRAVIHCYHLSS